jgi:hypothetical protein
MPGRRTGGPPSRTLSVSARPAACHLPRRVRPRVALILVTSCRARRKAAPQTATSAHRSTPARFAPTQIGPTARASGAVTAWRYDGEAAGLGGHTIAGRSYWRFLSPSRRLLLGAGQESHPRGCNNSEHGEQKQRSNRASHGASPSAQDMDVTIEGAARQCGRSASRSKPTGESYREAPLGAPRPRKRAYGPRSATVARANGSPLDRSRRSSFIWRAGSPRSLSGGAVTLRWPRPHGSPGLGPSHGVGTPLGRRHVDLAAVRR